MFKQNRGFTLFETLVVLSIIAIMAVLILARYRQGQQSYALEDVSQRFVSDIRHVQAMAIAGAETKKPDGTDYNVKGYGLYILNSSTYYLFLNTDSSRVWGAGLSVIVETKEIPNSVLVNQVGSSVFFVPPDPATYINGSNNDAAIDFVFSKNGGTRTVSVNSYGKIDSH